MDNRIEYIDFLRGLAIIFVVMGHIFQYNFYGDTATGCFNFIYSFHMGFFFFISGCTASLSSAKNTWTNLPSFLCKKGCQLLIPFLLGGVGLPFLLNNIQVSDIPSQLLLIVQYPDKSFWFLIFLFFIHVVYYICCAITARKKNKLIRSFILLFSLPVVIMLLLFKSRLLGIGEYTYISPDYLLLFIFGHFVQTYNIKEKYSLPLITLSFLLFVILVPYFNFWQSYTTNIRTVKILTSTLFSFAVYYMIKLQYSNFTYKVTRNVCYFGSHTLEIYVTHYCLIQICSSPWINTEAINPIPLFVIIFIMALPICLIIVFYCCPIKIGID